MLYCYKTTEEERRNNWILMLFLKKSIEYLEYNNRLIALQKEKKILKKCFTSDIS